MSPTRAKPRSMTIAGVMSGTSADGIDVAFVRITAPTGASTVPRLRLLAHHAMRYPATVRQHVLQAMNAQNTSVAELSRLHWRLGQLYADAIEKALAKFPHPLDLIGCHGQTIYHQATKQPFLGNKVACTWQMGEASVISARLGIPVVSDFRPADLALGGQGAPLVPLLDYVAFANAKRNRVLQNLGGIGNLTVIPAGGSADQVLAFDTGPANMILDFLMNECFDKPFDQNGAVAARGQVLEPVLRAALAHRFFQLPPPKSAGREEFGREFSAHFLASCRKHSRRAEDAVATATALTAHSIGIAWKKFVQPALNAVPTDYIVAGGGAKNPTLINAIAESLKPFPGITIKASDDFGIPAAAKEAVAFALLAWQTWHRQPGNLPGATGAKRPAILGKITHV